MKMETTRDRMHDHVVELGKAFNIVVVFDPRMVNEGMAGDFLVPEFLRWVVGGSRQKMIQVPPIVEETSYVIAMHEIGHHVAPNGRCVRKQPKPGSHPREWFEYFAAKLVCEEAAWEWARYYVEQMFEWTVAMEQAKQFAFATYQQARRTGR